MTKKMKFNQLCAVLIMLVFVVLFSYNGRNLYVNKFKEVKAGIESNFSTPPKEDFWKQSFYHYLMITNRKLVNGVALMDNEHLILEKTPNPLIVSARADIVIQLNDYFMNKGTPFLFLRVPCKNRDNSSMPKYTEDTALESNLLFVSSLKENGVETLDLRDAMISGNKDFATSFYKSDNHWTSETAFWAFGKVGDFLNSRYDFKLNENRWNPNEYEFITYKEAYTGVLATRIGNRKFKEDITAIIPKFSTSFEITSKAVEGNRNNEEGTTTTGDFVDVFIPAINREDTSYFNYSDLNAVVGNPFVQYKNVFKENRKRVLLIADSYGWPLASYLAVAFERLDYFYLMSAYTNEMFYEMIDNQKYDLVIFFTYEGTISNSGDDIKNDRMYIGNPEN